MPIRLLRPAALALAASATAAIASASNAAAIIVEAEDAALGAGLKVATESGVTYVEPTVNFVGSFPTSGANVATFSATFPEAGGYELYARIYVGPGAANDDSLIAATALGDAAIGSGGAWSVANNLWNAGFAEPDELILSVGDATTETWKWIRVSTFADVGILTVPAGQLTQTYKLASREDGLRIDKIAFGPLRVTFTVEQLEKGLPGADQRPPAGGEPFQAAGPILAHGKTKFLGSVWSGTSAYNKDFEFYWNGMWHGNAGKWGSVEGARDVMNWSVVDEGYEFAKAHGVKFNFHVLLWGAQQPSWISALPPAEQLEEIREWFQAVATRYPDIDYLQVVNEPINAPPDGGGQPGEGQRRADYIDALGGTGETGFDWILEAFRLAREYFPDTPLMLNEYNVEGDHARSDRYLEIIEALQAENLIDLVGFQGHAFSTKFSSVEAMEQILDKIAATGLPIMITEMEIDGHDDYVQLAEYQRVFPIYWDHPSVIGINLSGHIGNWRYDQGAYLVNDDFSERLALKWLREYVQSSGRQSYAEWLDARGLAGDARAPGADPDADGLANGWEYALGLDPGAPGADPFAWDLSGTARALSFSISHDIGEGLVEIQRSEDLARWETLASYDVAARAAEGLSVEDGEIGRTLRFAADASEERVFYRMRFSLPE